MSARKKKCSFIISNRRIKLLWKSVVITHAAEIFSSFLLPTADCSPFLNMNADHTPAHAAKLAPSLPSLPPSPTLFFHPHDQFSPPRHTCPPAVWLWVFWLFSWRWSNPSEQYWTSHSIQTSCLLNFFFLKKKTTFPCFSVLSFPFYCNCILCTLYL